MQFSNLRYGVLEAVLGDNWYGASLMTLHTGMGVLTWSRQGSQQHKHMTISSYS